MRKLDNYFCWSDNWWIEENNAWFVDGERDILFKLDFLTNQCEYIKEIPNNTKWKFRQNPRCLKYKNDIICLPDLSEHIWIYHADEFEKIEIKNPDKVRILINNFWIFDDKLYAVSVGLKQILEINLEKRRIDNYYTIYDSTIQIAGSVKVDEKIFVVSSISNQVYEFDLITKKTVIYELTDVNDKFYTICFDGKKFWLSGYNKAIYCWNKDEGIVDVINKFPKQFGIYDYSGKKDIFLNCELTTYDVPVFIDIKMVGKYVWCIPYQTNNILYIDKDIVEISIFDILNEKETDNSIVRMLTHKYLSEYIKDNRYIGIYSLKNNYVLEIDVEKMKISRKKFFFNNSCIHSLSESIGKVFYEVDDFNKMLYRRMLLMNKKHSRKENHIGKKVYNVMNDDKIC